MDELVAAVDSLRGETALLSMDELRPKLVDIATTLNVDQTTTSIALDLLEYIQLTNDTSDINQRYYIACSLFVAGNKRFNTLIPKTLSTHLSTEQLTHSVYLSQLLKTADIKMRDFFEILPSFVSMLRCDTQPLGEMTRKLGVSFVVLNVIYRKYEDTYRSCFQFNPVTDRLAGGGMGSVARNQALGRFSDEHLFDIGWHIYLYCKRRLFNTTPDLIQSTNLIICSINLVYSKSNLLSKLSLPLPPSSSHVGDNNNDNNNNNNNNNNHTDNPNEILEYLCRKIDISLYKELVNTNKTTFTNLVKEMVNDQLLQQSNNDIVFSTSNISSILASFNKHYERQYYAGGDIDERCFLTDKAAIGTPFKQANNNNNQMSAKKAMTPDSKFQQPARHARNNASDTPIKYPTTPSKATNSSGHLPATPISASLSMIAWIKAVSKSDDVLSTTESLIERGSKKETVQDISNRVKQLTQSIDKLYTSEELSEHGAERIQNKRRTYGVRLYYKLLGTIIEQELAKGSAGTKTLPFLPNEEFNRSLLATSYDMVCYAYKLDALLFPYFVNRFQILPYSHLRVIATVINLGIIPALLTQHLTSIETKIIEQYAWTTNSFVFTHIEQYREPLYLYATQYNSSSSSITTQGNIPSTPTKSNNTSLLSATPTKPNTTSTTTTTTTTTSNLQSPTPAAPGQQTSPVLMMFFRKLIMRLQAKLKHYATELSLPAQMVAQMNWVLLKLIIEHTRMLQDRYLDTAIACTVYAICKSNNMEIGFKSLLEIASIPTPAYKDIPLKEGESGNIIAFYNAIYLEEMTSTVVQAKDKVPQMKVPITTPTKQSMATVASPMSNVIFSPMGSAARVSSLTPSKTTSYSIGKTPTKELRSINMSINQAVPINGFGNSNSNNAHHQAVAGGSGLGLTSLAPIGSSASSTSTSTSSSSSVSPILSSASEMEFNENSSNGAYNSLQYHEANSKARGKRLFYREDDNGNGNGNGNSGGNSNNNSSSGSGNRHTPSPSSSNDDNDGVQEPPLKK
ncbi:hypothetical protein SAMD00019534_025540 [Acytostelium subglobosum LB1]|uniref:hypothetical protein n=1 Tax=Acytostelium subglobosum LB1 TaxID=1410327 RepID=UPI000644B27B|nr:hypothetical protein SAMD00019534_025540 [Acytostelium subglobosum LB1]GAM19379.1 hypothetical protein SAMD00019534_025540 [Acytostelium subglobosum LB1]|eukprot:XP_012757306.1 hypothetical protein SAMD00019534_025540 [Acytostelium subglobosum LB1]